jgi:hypothetical protein
MPVLVFFILFCISDLSKTRKKEMSMVWWPLNINQQTSFVESIKALATGLSGWVETQLWVRLMIFQLIVNKKRYYPMENYQNGWKFFQRQVQKLIRKFGYSVMANIIHNKKILITFSIKPNEFPVFWSIWHGTIVDWRRNRKSIEKYHDPPIVFIWGIKNEQLFLLTKFFGFDI